MANQNQAKRHSGQNSGSQQSSGSHQGSGEAGGQLGGRPTTTTGNFAEDRKKASEAGRKGGQSSQGGNRAKFSFQVQHRYASELRWEFTMVSSTLMSVTSFIVSGRTVEAFERSAA